MVTFQSELLETDRFSWSIIKIIVKINIILNSVQMNKSEAKFDIFELAPKM